MVGPCSKVNNPVAAVRQARIDPNDIEEIKESRVAETVSDYDSE